jgi:reductive dehalogenase
MYYFKITMSLIGISLSILMLLMLCTSLIERRIKATGKATLLLTLSLLIVFVPFLLTNAFDWIYITFDTIALLTGMYLFAPKFFFQSQEEDIPAGNIDERTIMFARKELKPGTTRYNDYYQAFPEHLTNDEKFRKLPGLLSPASTFFNPLSYEATDALFQIVDGLHNYVEGPAKKQTHPVSSEKFAQFIQQWTINSGAIAVGLTTMKNYHWYSLGGRGQRYGKPVDAKHKVGIVFTVEMDHNMVEAAPKSSIIMESATQYLKAGIIATQLAQFIRNCGFNARAHIDGNYQVVAPLVARDANLGEIGRMGLLMTPTHGPRVRLGVVTTDMPLPVSKRKYDSSFEDFCSKCLKCADNCPASAISENNKEYINGINRWQINSEKCFNYWCTAGTDCGRCMSTCPYSHPSNLLHNLVRWSIRNFPNFRYWAVKMDDFFYGRKSAPAKLPNWLLADNTKL